MPLSVLGTDALQDDLQSIIDTLSPASIEKALVAGAQPILEKMIANAPVRFGKLKGSIKIGKTKSGKGGRRSISIGSHREDFGGDVYYPAYVEYGHGGPHPAGAHPYARPAFDAAKDEAYTILRKTLSDEMKG